MSRLKPDLVIPTWEGRERLSPLLEVLAGERRDLGRVIVVDDGSTDGTNEWLRTRWHWVEVLRFERNGGFGAAANAGVLAARTPVVVLLNNDTAPERGFVRPLLRHFDAPETFAVSCRQEPGGGLCRGSFHAGLLRLRWRDGWTGPPTPTLYADGGASAFLREAFLELGGFDPLYRPFYGEDLDLSYRAWKRGYRVLHEPASVVHHARGGTIEQRFASNYVRAASLKNRILFMWRNVTDSGAFASHWAALPFRAARAVATIDRAWLLALRWAAQQRGEALAGRRRDLRSWVRTDAEVLAASGAWASPVPA